MWDEFYWYWRNWWQSLLLFVFIWLEDLNVGDNHCYYSFLFGWRIWTLMIYKPVNGILVFDSLAFELAIIWHYLINEIHFDCILLNTMTRQSKKSITNRRRRINYWNWHSWKIGELALNNNQSLVLHMHGKFAIGSWATKHHSIK
jgi:hypothetical protein